MIDDENNILIANYGNVILLPGGSIDKDEEANDAIIRELKEEVGVEYRVYELTYLNTLDYYQKDYPATLLGFLFGCRHSLPSGFLR